MKAKCDQCDQCCFSSNIRANVKRHKLEVHRSLKTLMCNFPGCNYRTNRSERLKLHKRKHETSLELRRPFACAFENCDYRAAEKKTLGSHVHVNHTPERTRDFKCPLCPSRFYSKHRLRRHIPCHAPERHLKCSHCNHTTHNKFSLENHERTVHEKSTMYFCSLTTCKFRTVHRSDLKAHERTHNPEAGRLFQCTFPDCAFRAAKKWNLKKHISGHYETERSQALSCPLCSKNFSCKSSLHVHIRGVHTKEKCYRCKECSFATPSARNLKKHCESRHEEGNPRQQVFKCHIASCLFQSNFSHNLKNHMLCHEQDPERRWPFQCPFKGCDYRRSTKRELAPHERHHSTSRTSLKCELCPRKYYPDSVSLGFHRFLCHNDGRYTCSVCKYPAYSASNLTNHVNICHNGRPRAKIGQARTFGNTGTDSFRCQICGHKASDELSVLVHSASHRVPIVLLNKFTLETL